MWRVIRDTQVRLFTPQWGMTGRAVAGSRPKKAIGEFESAVIVASMVKLVVTGINQGFA